MRAPHDLAGLRVGLLTASASRLGGGVFEAVVAQSAMLKRLGAEPVVFALADEHAAEDRCRFGAVPVHHLPVHGPAQVGFAPRLGPALVNARLDLLHLHGIWMYLSCAATRWARVSRRPYLISPHGMLDPWITRRGRAKKAVARLAYEKASWRAATAFHALTGQEARDIQRESGRGESIVIPNSGPLPGSARDRLPDPHVVYLGRIHPKKNISALLDAWARVATGDSRLTIAGWGDAGDLAQLRQRIRNGPPSIAFVGPVFGEDKRRLLESARFVVLPSFSEGLPMVVLEAWAAGVPTIMTEYCNLPQGFVGGAALRCGTEAADIASVLRRGLQVGERAWLAMAKSAQRLAGEAFGADVIAAHWADAYRSLAACNLAGQR